MSLGAAGRDSFFTIHYRTTAHSAVSESLQLGTLRLCPLPSAPLRLCGYFFTPEYSSICFVRSCGYEIVTSVMAPFAPVTAVSFGITKPL